MALVYCLILSAINKKLTADEHISVKFDAHFSRNFVLTYKFAEYAKWGWCHLLSEFIEKKY